MENSRPRKLTHFGQTLRLFSGIHDCWGDDDCWWQEEMKEEFGKIRVYI